MLKKIKFSGGFFANEIEMELFKGEDRMSLIYGKNGSGKSTISKAVLKTKGESVEDIDRSNLYAEDEKQFSDIQSIHVFNEDYVNSRVKIRADGLNTIVLLGELGNLEEQIKDLKLETEAETNNNVKLKKIANEYNESENKKSPAHCRIQISCGLTGDEHWAEREKRINDGKRNAVVSEKVIETIMRLTPTEKLTKLTSRFEQNLELLNQVRKNEESQVRSTVKLDIEYDEVVLLERLVQKVEKPVITDREQYLFQLIDDGKRNQINEMKVVFSEEKTEKCPFCFQEITEQGKKDLISSIEKVLSMKSLLIFY